MRTRLALGPSILCTSLPLVASLGCGGRLADLDASAGPPAVAPDAGCDDTANDPDNCGSCGHACGPGAVCRAGACHCDSTTCPAGCCDANGQCHTTPSSTTCGLGGGAACQDCTNGTACTADGTQCVCAAACSGCCEGPFPLDPSRYTVTPTYASDAVVVVDGDDVSASPSGWLGPFLSTFGYVFTPGSILWGSGSTLLDAPGSPGLNDYAVAGQTCATMTANAKAKIDPYATAAKDLVFQCGLNDGLAGASGAATCSRIQAYGQARVAAGWKHVWLVGMLDSSSLPTGYAGAVNQCLRGGWASWGLAGFVDVGADAYLGLPAGDAQRSTWFNPDGTTTSSPNGSIRYAFAVVDAVRRGAWQ